MPRPGANLRAGACDGERDDGDDDKVEAVGGELEREGRPLLSRRLADELRLERESAIAALRTERRKADEKLLRLERMKMEDPAWHHDAHARGAEEGEGRSLRSASYSAGATPAHSAPESSGAGGSAAPSRAPSPERTALAERIESVKVVLRKLYNGDPDLCSRYLVPDYWRKLVDGTGLTLSEGDPLLRSDDGLHSTASVPPSSLNEAAECLDERGYFVLDDVRYDPPASFSSVAEGVRRIKDAGWPAAFVLLYDQPWRIVDALFSLVGPVLGGDGGGPDDVELETDISVWALDKGVSDGRYTDGNFSTPHRDSSYDDSVCSDGDGAPVKLSVWIPLVDATLDNGCMYVLPKNCDELFDKPCHPLHMSAAQRDQGTGDLTCRFPIQHARPLPAPAGSVLSWMGNLIHWGSSCSPHRSVERPRMSMAFTLRRRKYRDDERVTTLTGRAPLARSSLRDMKFENRLSVAGKSLIMYYHWTNGYAGLDLEKMKRGVL